ncbi:hypothetical protein RQP46_004168 [Phenoliferia psychrophenolica]
MGNERNERLRAPSGNASVGCGEDERLETAPHPVISVYPTPALRARPSLSARQTSAATSSTRVSLFENNYWSSEDSSDDAGGEGSDADNPTLGAAEEGDGGGMDIHKAEWKSLLSIDLGKNAILEQLRVGKASLQLPSRAMTETLLNNTPSGTRRHRQEYRRYNHYARFCRNNSVPVFPISVHLVEFYLTQRRYREPGAHVATLERIRQATSKLWSGREGYAGAHLDAYESIGLLLNGSAFFKSVQGTTNASEEADDDDSDEQAAMNASENEARRAAPEISESEHERSWPHPSPTKRSKSTPSSRRVDVVPVLGTAPSNTAASSSSSTQPSRSFPQNFIQQQQQQSQSIPVPPTPTPSSPAVGLPPALPLAASPLPAQTSALEDFKISPLDIQCLLCEIHPLLDDASLATTLHDLGLTTTSAFSHFIFLDQQSAVYKYLVEKIEGLGVTRDQSVILGMELKELRSTLRQ